MYSQVSNAASAERDALAEIDPARQLANHEDVDAFELLRLQRRGGRELRHGRHGAEIREQAERLADREQALLGAVLHGNVGPLRTADGAEQDAVDALQAAIVFSGSGDPSASYAAPPINESSNSSRSSCCDGDLLEHPNGCPRDLGTDAVAGQYHDVRAHVWARS